MKDIINETVPHCDILEANRKKGKMIKIKINHKKVEQLKSFYGVKLKGDETFNELLAIEKKNKLKGVTICKSKNCNQSLYKNQSQIDKKYCMECA